MHNRMFNMINKIIIDIERIESEVSRFDNLHRKHLRGLRVSKKDWKMGGYFEILGGFEMLITFVLSEN
jgi:hypothetical protein